MSTRKQLGLEGPSSERKGKLSEVISVANVSPQDIFRSGRRNIEVKQTAAN